MKNFNFNDWQSRIWGRPANPVPGEEPRPNRKPREFVEEIRVSGKNLVSEVERLLREGEVRRLRIRQGDRVLLDVPVAWAAVGAVIAPALAAVGAIAAVVTDCTIEVIRSEDRKPKDFVVTPDAKTAPNAGPKSPDDLSYR